MSVSDNPFLLVSGLFLIVLFGYQCEKTRVGKQLSAPLIILVTSFILGNVGLMPNQSAVYGVVQSIFVPLAIPLLLFRANIRKVMKESGQVLLAFMLAVAFTVAGALAGAWFIDLGDAEGQLVGVLAASYIGGSANFVATAQAVGFTDSSLYTSALTADAIGAMVFLTLLMLLPGLRFVVNRFPAPSTTTTEQSVSQASQPADQPVSESGIILSVTTSAVICALGFLANQLLPFEGAFIVFITLLALLVANFTPKAFINSLSLDYELGTLFMYVFFATIGVSADMHAMAEATLPIVGFLLILVVVHIGLLVWIGSLFRLQLAELLIASCACILGPSAAAAIAAGKNWRGLVTPGVLVGVLGYAIATFIGISLNAWLG